MSHPRYVDTGTRTIALETFKFLGAGCIAPGALLILLTSESAVLPQMLKSNGFDGSIPPSEEEEVLNKQRNPLVFLFDTASSMCVTFSFLFLSACHEKSLCFKVESEGGWLRRVYFVGGGVGEGSNMT